LTHSQFQGNSKFKGLILRAYLGVFKEQQDIASASEEGVEGYDMKIGEKWVDYYEYVDYIKAWDSTLTKQNDVLLSTV
jgi:hypothetical protein